MPVESDDIGAVRDAVDVLLAVRHHVSRNGTAYDPVADMALNWLSRACHHLVASLDTELRGGKAAVISDEKSAAAIVKGLSEGLREAANDLKEGAEILKRAGIGHAASEMYGRHVRARNQYLAIAGLEE